MLEISITDVQRKLITTNGQISQGKFENIAIAIIFITACIILEKVIISEWNCLSEV
jgi:hypothetical protein